MWQVAIEIAKRAGGDPGRMGLFGPSTTPEARKPMTLAVMEAEGWALMDEASKVAFETVIERIRAAGVTVLRRGDNALVEAFERSLQGVQALTGAITGWENHWGIRNLIATSGPDGVSQRGQNVVAAAEKWTPDDYRAAVLQREEIRTRHAALAPLVDAMIAPASPGIAPPWSPDVPGQPLAKRPTGDAVYNTPSSALGAPVVTSPMTSVGGMPMGIQLVGQPHSDAAMTAIARWMVGTIEPAVA
jgi:Asp-tRNA(Asn)/Glu-tRNA(Gln) amidotransferase A subunit family amidase